MKKIANTVPIKIITATYNVFSRPTEFSRRLYEYMKKK